jgi:AbrB family looped-hinge helix DNA binding protein
MHSAKISSKFQVVIPRTIRKSLGLRAGQKIQMVEFDNRIEIVPITPLSSLRGFAKGISTTVERENDRLLK